MPRLVKAKAGCSGCIYEDDLDEWELKDDDWMECKHMKECEPDPDDEDDYDKIFIASED